mmetsp:Transcript_133259/g.385708  ORF Transcript_133259/g.385708 Transcript_133259/m.385708 type:complete len:203 (-) Transcript_133259:395-1003(-)
MRTTGALRTAGVHYQPLLLAECNPFCREFVYWFIACTISSSVCSRAWAEAASMFFMPAISSKMNARNFSVLESLASSLCAMASTSRRSWSIVCCICMLSCSSCAASALSSSASRRRSTVSLSMRDFRSESICFRIWLISFTSAAVSTASLEGSSPRNCAMPFSNAVARIVRDSTEAASFSIRTRIFDCNFSSMSLANCSVNP